MLDSAAYINKVRIFKKAMHLVCVKQVVSRKDIRPQIFFVLTGSCKVLMETNFYIKPFRNIRTLNRESTGPHCHKYI